MFWPKIPALRQNSNRIISEYVLLILAPLNDNTHTEFKNHFFGAQGLQNRYFS